jgi:uncharacterized protein (TIGR02444 family)
MAEFRSPFWEYSLRVYGKAGVPQACLVLQETCGVDVNVALFLLWHAAEGRALSAEDLARVDALVADWRRDVVVKLRDVRQALKPLEASPDVAALRRQVKQVELESERLQQEMLYREAAGFGRLEPDRRTAAAENLRHYAARFGTAFPADAVAILTEASLG